MIQKLSERVDGAALTLAPADKHQLIQLEKKLQLVRDRTASVAMSYTTGFFLHGGGGLGKSYTVLDELHRLNTHHVVFNSRMTGRGLYNALERFPDAVHVLEDMEPIMRDKGAQGVLRSALWCQRREGQKGPSERPVTWTTFKMEHNFFFTGGIIMISNRPMHDMPELNAIKTRIAVMHLQATDSEMRALMRKVALNGYQHDGRLINPAECMTICQYIIEQSSALSRSLDMRLLITSFQDYLQWQECDSASHWRDLVDARLRERPSAFREEVAVGSRAARKQRELDIAREIMAQTADRRERYRRWSEQTDKSEPAFYRRVAELGDA